MDDARFDTLARTLAAAHSRRGLTQLLGGTILGGPLALAGLAETGSTKKRAHRKKNRRRDTGGQPAVPDRDEDVVSNASEGLVDGALSAEGKANAGIQGEKKKGKRKKKRGPTGPAGVSDAQFAAVQATQSTTSTTFTDLSTPGPSAVVTVPASGRVLVMLTANLIIGQGASAVMSFGSTGGSGDVDPDVSRSLSAFLDHPTDEAIQMTVSASAAIPLAGLSPGKHTFAAKYRSSFGQEVGFSARYITVIPLP